MLLPRNYRISCSNCGNEIELTTAAHLQANKAGVSCECGKCASYWIYPAETKSFSLHLRTEEKDSAQESLPPQGKPFKSSYPTVFVVDDDVAMRESLARLITSEQFDVETYHSAEDFLQKCEMRDHGCLLLDLNLPGMDGLNLLQELSLRKSSLPVIMMSAAAEIQTVARCFRFGIIDFLEKPFHPVTLLASVRRAVNESIGNDRNVPLRPNYLNVSQKAALENTI